MKKLLCMITVVLLVLASFVGCSDNTDKDSIVLTFWAHQNTAWNNSYKDVIKKFEDANPGIKIKLETFPYDQFESKVQTSLLTGEGGADIYELWGGWAIDFAPNGALLALPDDLASEIINDTYGPTVGALLHEGKLYALPLEFNIESGGMLINNKLFKDAGISVPTTWDEMVQAGKTLTQMDGELFAVKGFDFVNWDSVPYTLTSMILSQGGNYLKSDGTIDFNTPEAKKAFTELARLVTDVKVTNLEGLTGGGELEGYQLLYANKAGIVPRGPWAISEGIEEFDLKFKEEFDYVEMPWFGTQKKFASETGWSIAVNAKTTQQEAAEKFMNFFYQDDILLQHNINCTQIPAKKSVAHDENLTEAMPYLSVLIANLENAQFIGYFNTDQFKETVNNVFVDYCMGLYPNVDEALKDLTTKLNAIVK